MDWTQAMAVERTDGDRFVAHVGEEWTSLQGVHGGVVAALALTSVQQFLGDAASFPSAHTGGRIRLESVQNAVDQARHVAARLMGASVGYDALPWFWSDQGDLKIQIAGLAETKDGVVELSLTEPRQKVVLRFRQDRLVAVETVNRPGDHILARRILAGSSSPTPTEASTPGFDLTTWHEAQAAVTTG